MAAHSNILLIIMDAVRQDHLSLYGSNRKTTPFIDDLAQESIVFRNAYSTAPWTVPSHASLFTGLYPSEHKAQNEHMYLDEKYQTVAQIFSKNNYRTVGFSDNSVVGKPTGLNRGFEYFDEVWRRYKHKSKLDMYIVGLKRILHMTDRGANETTRLAIEWIENKSKHEEPFFMFINYMDAHQVCHPPKAFLDEFPERKYSIQKMVKCMRAYLNLRVKYYSGQIELNDDDMDHFKWIYDAAIRYLDSEIHKLYECLRKKGLADNTIFIITSDHGTHLGEHGLLHHEYSVANTLLRVPLIVTLPHFNNRRTVVDHPVQLSDLFFFLFQWSGVEMIQHPGNREYLQFNTVVSEINEKHPIFGEYRRPESIVQALSRMVPHHDFSAFDRGLRAIQIGTMKYVWCTDGCHELYNLEEDYGENENKYEEDFGSSQHMQEHFAAFLSSLIHQDEAEVRREFEADDEVKERLRALGYLG